MLYDRVYEHIARSINKKEERLLPTLHVANKFSFEESFAKTAAVLGHNSDDIRKALQYVKLPYDICWFECPDVLFELKSAKRVGFLLKNETIQERTFILYNMAIHNLEGEIEIQSGFLGFDLRDLGGAMKIGFVPNDPALHPIRNELTFATMSWLCGMLILLNQPRFIEKEESNLRKLNSSRKKKGKPELAEHTIVYIKPQYKGDFNEAYDGIMNEKRNIRSHTRRGHFKVLKSGKVSWWSPHIVKKNGVESLSRKIYKAK